MRKQLFLIIAGILVVAGCATADQGDPSAPPAGPDLAFTATTIDGQEFAGTTLAGKPAVLWFWAPWCPTCAAQAPDVKAVAAEHGDSVQVIGVAGLGTSDAMAEFIDRTDTAELTHIADESGAVWRRFGITAQSTFVLIDADGAIVHSGYLDPGDFTAMVNELAESA